MTETLQGVNSSKIDWILQKTYFVAVGGGGGVGDAVAAIAADAAVAAVAAVAVVKDVVKDIVPHYCATKNHVEDQLSLP